MCRVYRQPFGSTMFTYGHTFIFPFWVTKWNSLPLTLVKRGWVSHLDDQDIARFLFKLVVCLGMLGSLIDDVNSARGRRRADSGDSATHSAALYRQSTQLLRLLCDWLVVAVMFLGVVCSVLTVIQFSQGIQTVSSKTMYTDLGLYFKVITSMYELSCRIIIFRGTMIRTSTH